MLAIVVVLEEDVRRSFVVDELFEWLELLMISCSPLINESALELLKDDINRQSSRLALALLSAALRRARLCADCSLLGDEAEGENLCGLVERIECCCVCCCCCCACCMY